MSLVPCQCLSERPAPASFASPGDAPVPVLMACAYTDWLRCRVACVYHIARSHRWFRYPDPLSDTGAVRPSGAAIPGEATASLSLIPPRRRGARLVSCGSTVILPRGFQAAAGLSPKRPQLRGQVGCVCAGDLCRLTRFEPIELGLNLRDELPVLGLEAPGYRFDRKAGSFAAAGHFQHRVIFSQFSHLLPTLWGCCSGSRPVHAYSINPYRQLCQ